MKWVGRILFALAFTGMAALAAFPYLDTLRQKWDQFQKAWQLVNSNSSTTVETETEKPEPEETGLVRTRSITLPDAKNSEANSEPSENRDPFLVEARRRAKENPAAAMAWLQTEATGKDRLRGMLEIVALWAAKDAESALLWLESNAPGLARIETLNSGIELWSQQDPVAAAEWIDGMANDGSKLAVAKTLAANWASQNPDDASKWVAQLPEGNLRNAAAGALIESWAKTDPKAATIWAFSEAEFNGNVDLFNRSIEYYAEANPAEAEQLLRAVTEAHEAPGSVDTYVRTLAQDSPEDAIDWLNSLDANDPLNQSGNIEIILQEWGSTDSVAASAWLSKTTPGPQRDAAIAGFTKSIVEFDPEVAVTWSTSIADPKKRNQNITWNVQKWAETQPEQALEWVQQQTELEPKLRYSLINSISIPTD